MNGPLHVLFLADTHLGFDLPTRPRIARRRRGHDFFRNYHRALAPALRGEVDLVVHGGDVFHRSRIPPSLTYQAFEPLKRIADTGIPVVVVPGNHERSRIPHLHLARHPCIHVFGGPACFRITAGGIPICIAGFAYERRNVRRAFPELLLQTGWRRWDSPVRLLCLHHCFEGATVGPSGFTFTRGPQVIRGKDVPPGFAAVLSGHIHRHQILRTDLAGHRLDAPVLYPGSIERTSIAERAETKGTLVLAIQPGPGGGALTGLRFSPLPTRPMEVLELSAEGLDRAGLERAVVAALTPLAEDAIVRLRLACPNAGDPARLPAARLRELAPDTMNVDLRWVSPDGPHRSSGTGGRTSPSRP